MKKNYLKICHCNEIFALRCFLKKKIHEIIRSNMSCRTSAVKQLITLAKVRHWTNRGKIHSHHYVSPWLPFIFHRVKFFPSLFSTTNILVSCFASLVFLFVLLSPSSTFFYMDWNLLQNLSIFVVRKSLCGAKANSCVCVCECFMLTQSRASHTR